MREKTIRFAVTALGAGLLLQGVVACRSAAPQKGATTPAPAQPSGGQPVASAAQPTATGSSLPSPPAATAPASAPVSRATETTSAPQVAKEPGAESSEMSEEEAAGAPAAAQKEALDLCQSAADLIERGERVQAIAALDKAYELMLSLPVNGDDAVLQVKDDIRVLVSDLIRKAFKREAAPPSTSWDLALPIVDNDHVRREIASFTGPERELFIEAYRRSGLYRPMILAKLEAARLPSQLSWLPMVESWFKVRALSRASALGPWQFLASTGQRYGLSRDGWVDERMDPEKSTDAAIAYLTELHGFFGDWPKALAAYNCGEARVLRLGSQSADRYFDFWDLYEQLPFETRRYVPRFIAALLVIEAPAKYGMTLPEPLPPMPPTAKVRVDRAVALDKLAAALGLTAEALVEMNPELRFAATPGGPYDLKVPAGLEGAVPTAVAQLPAYTRPQPQFITHRVRRGETLGQIARIYGTSASAIQRANGLRSANRLQIGQKLRIPVAPRRRS